MTGRSTRFWAVRPRGWSVRTRLAVVSTVVATVGLGVAGATAYVVTSKVLHEQVDESLRLAPTGIVAPKQRSGPEPPDLCQSIKASRAPSPGQFRLSLIREDGTVCSDPDEPAVVLIASDFHAGSSTGPSRVRLRDGQLKDGTHVRIAVTPALQGSVLVLARDTEPVRRVLDILKLTLLGVTLLGAAIAAGFSRWTAGVGLRPITRFARVAESIAETGSLVDHVTSPEPVHAGGSGDELDRLAHAFNQMTAVLADAQMRQRRLVADAGHELRTPLSSLRSNISLLTRSRRQGRPLPDGEEERTLADLSSQAVELTRLVDDLVELATPETSAAAFSHVRFDQCIQDAVDRARRRTPDHIFEVALSPWLVWGDAPALERAAMNLLDNAIKFSPPGSTIHVELFEGTLTVTDSGPGVSEDEGRRAFHRFWRSPSARALPGSGLGLSIVDDVAQRHHGRAELRAGAAGGAVATLQVPGTDESSALAADS